MNKHDAQRSNMVAPLVGAFTADCPLCGRDIPVTIGAEMTDGRLRCASHAIEPCPAGDRCPIPRP